MAEDTPNFDPSAGSSAEGGTPEPSPSSDTRNLTESEIWERHPEIFDEREPPTEDSGATTEERVADAPTEETPDEEKAVGEEEEKPAEEGEEKVEDSPPEDERPVVEEPEPEHIRKTLDALKGHPKLRAQVRDLHYSNVAYREAFDTPAQARQFRETFPTLDDAKVAATKAETLDVLDETFDSNPRGLVRNLAKDPRRFAGLVSAIHEELSQLTDETGRPDTRFNDYLRGRYTADQVAQMRAKYADDEDAIGIIERFEAMALGERGAERAPTRTPENDPVLRENQELKAREAKRQTEAFGRFVEQRNGDFQKALETEVDAKLAAAAKDASIPKGALDKIRGEVLDAIDELMVNNRIFQSELIKRTTTGRNDAAHREALVKFMLNQATARLPFKVREIVSKWTKEILATNAKHINQRTRQAERRDVSTGHAGGKTSTTANRDVSTMSPAEKAAFYKKYPDEESIWRKHGLI